MPSHLFATVLIDNDEAEGLCCEWGLSVHVRYGGQSILLDFGQSNAFARNAQVLGIDLSAVDLSVLSHAHYDHADGMETFFLANDHAPLYLSERCTESCWSTSSGTAEPHYIGIRAGSLERFVDRMVPVPTDHARTIAPGVHLVPHSTPGLARKGEHDGMLVDDEGGWQPDDFAHEMSLVLELDGPGSHKIAILSSCSHAGPSAIVSEVRAAFPGRRIAAFVGGLHLAHASDEDIRAVGRELRDAHINAVWTGHCTGEHAIELLCEELPGRVRTLRPGLRFCVDAIDWSPLPFLPAPADLEVVVCDGMRDWGAHESGELRLPLGTKTVAFPIAYDERDAPFVVDEDGDEREEELISLSDEGWRVACAWVHAHAGSSIRGVGVDLAASADFAPRPGSETLIRAMFSERERELARELYPDDLPLAYATLFGAKEAAFKATAQALRSWYRAHSEALEYEVRDFCMTEPGVERGEMRRGAAQAALDRMGIARIEVRYAALDDMALVVAVALAARTE